MIYTVYIMTSFIRGKISGFKERAHLIVAEGVEAEGVADTGGFSGILTKPFSCHHPALVPSNLDFSAACINNRTRN
jgi:hypothetical protein